MEKPILFNTEMVRAILDGRKNRTSRPIKRKYENTHIEWRTDKYGTRLVEIQNSVEGETFGTNSDGSHWHKLLAYGYIKPQYQVGDTLYVRETWCRGVVAVGEEPDGRDSEPYVSQCTGENEILFKEDIIRNNICTEDVIWHPSIHMPKSAARIFLKVTGVKAQKLEDITEEEAIKEGAKDYPKPSIRHANWDDRWIKGVCSDCKHFNLKTGLQECCFKCDNDEPQFRTSGGCNSGFELRSDDEYEPARFRFSYLWDSISSYPGWNSNPWVWAYEFERMEGYNGKNL